MMTRIIGGVPTAQSWSRYDAAQHDVGGMALLRNGVGFVVFVDYVNGFVVSGGCDGFVDYVNGNEAVTASLSSLTMSTGSKGCDGCDSFVDYVNETMFSMVVHRLFSFAESK